MPLRTPPTEELHRGSEDLDLLPIPEVVRRLHREDRTAFEAVGRVLPQVSVAAREAAQALERGGRLVYVGAGTSGRLGMLDAAECPPTFGARAGQVIAILAGGPEAASRAVEGAEDDARAGASAVENARVGPSDFVIGVSASSTTPFVQAALRTARRKGARTALVCCNPEAARRRMADVLVLPDTGPELIAGSTRLKAGTATKLVLNAISTAAMVSLGKVYRGRMVDLTPTSRKLRLRARRMVQELTGLSEARAGRLLSRAGGRPKTALAMHLSGLGREAAERLARRVGLRGLESSGGAGRWPST
ncbi:MAG: N-acetylmuramic acid 6-phosphate etherase [Myxococcales bacterium]|nr:N-acetylmuramic acid 6-phosphate etherase [Myxococcales bacterium]